MFAKFMALPVEVEPDISAYFGPGADPAFDKVLTSLGHIGSHKPTPVINTVMYWRKAKTDGDGAAGGRSVTPAPPNVPAAAAAAVTAGVNPSLPVPTIPSTLGPSSGASTPPILARRQTEPTIPGSATAYDTTGQYLTQRAAIAQQILKDRQNRCAIYILCRALIEVVKHTTADALTEDVASKIEPIVFKELSAQDAENGYRGGSIKSANWNIFAELLGCFSTIRYCTPCILSLLEVFVCQRQIYRVFGKV
jgi:Cell morphogenesis N-terminal